MRWEQIVLCVLIGVSVIATLATIATLQSAENAKKAVSSAVSQTLICVGVVWFFVHLIQVLYLLK